MKIDFILERRSQNKLNPDITKRNLRNIVASIEANKSFLLRGRIAAHLPEPELFTEDGKDFYRYRVKFRVVKQGKFTSEESDYARGVVRDEAMKLGWGVVGASGEVEDQEEAEVSAERKPRPPFRVPTLDREAMTVICRGIYDREEHVRIIHDGVVDFFDTLERHAENPRIEVSRPHVLLKGPPAGAKTALFERLKDFYDDGADVERVTFVDTTTITKAGIENWILDKAEEGELTEILVLEEIEKQSPDNLLSLISLMASGHISKMNCRVGHRKEVAQNLIWATCNQEDVIRKFRCGVLWSRFSNRLHCVRPDRERMTQILKDKVRQRKGDSRWADAAIEFAYETVFEEFGQPLDDPREIIALLCGRGRLVDGSYQEDRLAIMRAELAEKEAAAIREAAEATRND